MKFFKRQFRLSMLFHVTSAVACGAALHRAVGFDGILVLLLLALLPFVVVAYLRTLGWLFDVMIGPFLLR